RRRGVREPKRRSLFRGPPLDTAQRGRAGIRGHSRLNDDIEVCLDLFLERYVVALLVVVVEPLQGKRQVGYDIGDDLDGCSGGTNTKRGSSRGMWLAAAPPDLVAAGWLDDAIGTEIDGAEQVAVLEGASLV